MRSVTFWCAGPDPQCTRAAEQSATVVQRALMAARVHCTLSLEQVPAEPPPPLQPRGLLSGVDYVAAIILPPDVNTIVGEPRTLITLVSKPCLGRRPIAVALYVDEGFGGKQHEDMAAQLPADAGLEPWPIRRYSGLLDLAQQMTFDLIALSFREATVDGGQL